MARPETPSVSAVVVYYRSEGSIVGCVESLAGTEVVVVANSPVPLETAARLRELGAEVVELASNAGFGAACNAGAARAKGDVLLFVNPDVRCLPGAVEVLASAAAEGTIVGPAVRREDGAVERSVKSAAYVSAAALAARELLVGRWLRIGSPPPPDERRAVDILSGACLAVRADVFQRLGGFDELFFLYGEDVDLCLRARALGVACVYEPAAAVVHASGTGGGGARPDDDVLAIKGREIRRAHAALLAAHRGPASRRRYLAALSVVLRVRRLAAGLLGNRAEQVRSAAALGWLRSEARGPAAGGRRLAVLGNGAHRTGAPLSLLALLSCKPADVAVSLAVIGDGPLVPDFERVADEVEVLPAPRTRGLRPGRVLEEAATWRAVGRWGRRHRGWPLLVNTCEFEAALWLARRHGGCVAIRETTAYLQGPRGRVRGALLRSGPVQVAGVGRAQSADWADALGKPVRHLVNVYEHGPAPRPRPPARPLRFLFVGGTSPTKGLDLAMAAFARAGLELSVAGAARVDAPHVRALGVVPDLGARIGEVADVLVGASRAETFSRTVVEAALAGVPTVAWRAGGYVEQVDALGGWLVDAFDVDALAAQLRELASMDDEAYIEAATRVAANARRLFDPEAAAQAWWDWLLGSASQEGR